MKSRGRILLRNPIVSRVRRHATVATLFRAVEPPPVQRTDEPAAQPPVAAAGPATARTTVVQATLLPAATSLPTGYVTGVPLAPAEADAWAVPPVQRSPVAAEAMRPSSPPAEGPIVQPSPTTPTEEESTFSEAVWRRLQTIFRRHQEKQATPETVPEAQAPSTPVQPRPTPQEAPPVQRAEEAALPTPAREPLPTKAVSELPPPHSPPIQRTVDETRAYQPATTPPATAPTAPQEPGLAHPAAEEAPTERPYTEPGIEERPELPAAAEAPAIQPPKALTPADQPTIRPFPEPSVEEETTATEPQWQPLPLQDVWPVQRLEAPPVPAGPPARPPSISTPGPGPEPLPISGEEEIQRALADMAPGRPTASSIEVITPRQPRPEFVERLHPEAGIPPETEGPRPEAGVPPEIEGPRPEFIEEPRPALPEEPPVIPRVAEPAKLSRPQGLPGETALPPPTVQMQRETSAPTRLPVEVPAPDLVQTEIGPLPADLWRLLGQSPPGQEPAEVPPPQSPPPSAAKAAAEAPSRPERPAIREIIPPVVQRAAAARSVGEANRLIQREPEGEQAEAVATDSAAPRRAEVETTREPPAPGIDVDDLARRVYAEIKRRLSTEWERARRMF